VNVTGPVRGVRQVRRERDRVPVRYDVSGTESVWIDVNLTESVRYDVNMTVRRERDKI
jgi:hypothetical protein